MTTAITTTTVVVLLLSIPNFANARIINIPDDHETIQAGIDASEDDDTVLVQPGDYVENINFHGKSISVLWDVFCEDGSGGI